jgi:pectinesterase
MSQRSRFLFCCIGAMTYAMVCRGQTKSINVAADGSSDFKTVQEAIAAVPDDSTTKVVIHIAPGTYAGPFIVPKSKPNITMVGDNEKTTILTWDRNVRDPIPKGNDGFNPGFQVRADDFLASRLTIENTSGDHGQALALRVDGDRDVFVNCRITGWQDTLMVNNGRDYFKNCYVAGRVDFIYGSATAWFEDCEVHSKNGGHVTAASTPQDHPYGFVFMECKLTGDAIAWDPATTNPSTTAKPRVTPLADLGRPWRPYASVTYINCEMGSHIKPAGWNNWGKTSNESTARYSEYHSAGPGGVPDDRVAWSHQLTDDQAKAIAIQAVLAGDDGWDPTQVAAGASSQPTTKASEGK